MALLHQAELRPSKIGLIERWAPTQPWFEGSADASFTVVGSFRFDDPDGEVGIETVLVGVGDGTILQVPMTYRGAPLAGGQAEQYIEVDSVLVVQESTAVVTGSGPSATPMPSLPADGTVSTRHERGATVVEAGALRLVVARVLAAGKPRAAAFNDSAPHEVLTGTWTDQPDPQRLVRVQAR